MSVWIRLLVSIVAGALVAPAPGATADDRPVVAVQFVLGEPKYKLKFDEATRRAIEAAAAERIAERLGARIRFLRFRVQDGADTVLRLELNRQDRSGTGSIREVGFHVALLRGGQPMGPGAYVVFRPQSESLAPIPDREALLEALGPKISDAAAPSGPITTLLMKAIPIAREARLLKNPFGWIIPYRHDDLCMDDTNVLKLANTVDAGGVTVVREFTARTSGRISQGEFRGRILSEPHPVTQAELENFKRTPLEQVHVDAVYVFQYSPRSQCDALVAPPAR